MYKIKPNLYRLICVALISSMLSGCMTYLLSNSSRNGEEVTKDKYSDTIIGMSLAQSQTGQKGWVLTGKSYDYLLVKGGDKVVDILKDELIIKKNLTVESETRILIDANNKSFTGGILLNYKFTGEEDKTLAENYGFKCNGSMCSYYISPIGGTIHKKNSIENYKSKMLMFENPFEVKFYESHYSSGDAKLVFMPVTIALDIVTAPLQLLALLVIIH